MNRRTVVEASLGGGVCGLTWSLGFGYFLHHHDPYIDVIGRKHSQFVLIDADRFRMLVATGPADDKLVDHLPSMLGSFRRRLDLIAGASLAIEAIAARFGTRFQHVRTSILDAGEDLKPRILDVSKTLAIELNPGIGAPDRWNVVVRNQNVSCVIGPASFGTLDVNRALAISPARDLAGRASTTSAINAENVPDGVPGSNGGNEDPYLVRIFPTDVARFVLTRNGIRLPDWAERRKLAGA